MGSYEEKENMRSRKQERRKTLVIYSLISKVSFSIIIFRKENEKTIYNIQLKKCLITIFSFSHLILFLVTLPHMPTTNSDLFLPISIINQLLLLLDIYGAWVLNFFIAVIFSSFVACQIYKKILKKFKNI